MYLYNYIINKYKNIFLHTGPTGTDINFEYWMYFDNQEFKTHAFNSHYNTHTL